MAKNNTNSFVNRLTETLTKYNLPCAQELLHCMPCKQEWKITIKNVIQLFWKEKWTTEKEYKSTMQFLDIQQQPFRNPHQIWKLVPNNTLEIKKKLRLKPSYSPEHILYNQIELNLVSQQMTFVCYVKVTRKIQNISY
jgi:hypothetical protein